jgi:hypothetical protein
MAQSLRRPGLVLSTLHSGFGTAANLTRNFNAPAYHSALEPHEIWRFRRPAQKFGAAQKCRFVFSEAAPVNLSGDRR